MIKQCIISLHGYLGNYIFILGAFIKLKNIFTNIEFKLITYTDYDINNLNETFKQYILNNLINDIDESLYNKHTNINSYEEAINIINNESNNILFYESYFQSDSSVKDNVILKSLINYKDESYNLNFYINKFELIKNTDDYVIISVRRGDYVFLKKSFYLLNDNYYKTIYKKYFNGKIPIITSDDINWCRKKLCNIHNNIIYIENVNPINIIMLCSKYFSNIICSNSTFSSSIALLMNNEKGFKFYPSLKYLDEPNNNLIDKVLNTFTEVNTKYNKIYLEIEDTIALIIISLTYYDNIDNYLQYYFDLGIDHIFLITEYDYKIKNHDVTCFKYKYDNNKYNIIEYIYNEYSYNYNWLGVLNIGDKLVLNNNFNSIKDYLSNKIFAWVEQIHINYYNKEIIMSFIRTNIKNIKFIYNTFISEFKYLNTVNNAGNVVVDNWNSNIYDDTFAVIYENL